MGINLITITGTVRAIPAPPLDVASGRVLKLSFLIDHNPNKRPTEVNIWAWGDLARFAEGLKDGEHLVIVGSLGHDPHGLVVNAIHIARLDDRPSADRDADNLEKNWASHLDLASAGKGAL